MTKKVEPGSPGLTHHISLSDGEKEIGLILSNVKGDADPKVLSRTPLDRTAFKTTTGNSGYSDFDYPWTPIAQQDFSGGRGCLDFDDDTARYADSKAAWAFDGKVTHAPLPKYTTGYRSADSHLPGSLQWTAIMGGQIYLGRKFNASASYNAIYIWLHIRRKGTPPAALTINLCSDNAGIPGNILKTTTITTTNITDVISEFYRSTITSQALTSGIDYWITLTSASGTNVNHWEIGTEYSDGSKQSLNGSTWADTNKIDLYFRVTAADVNKTPILFQYRRALYMVLSPATGAPTLYINGDRGFADSNSGDLTKLNDGTKAWSTNQLAGSVVLIIAGPGSQDPIPYRNVVSNTDKVITLDSAWTTAHTTDTEYVVIGSDVWTEIAGHGLTGPVTGVLVVNNIMYLCQGDAIAIRRGKYDITGAGSYTWAADSTNMANQLCTVLDATVGLLIHKANNSNASGFISTASSEIKEWGVDLIFTYTEDGATTAGSKAVTALITANIRVGMSVSGTGIQPKTVVTSITNGTDITIDKNATATGAPTLTFDTILTYKDEWGRINKILEYGTTKYLWILREGSVFALSGANPNEIPLGEMHAVMSENNGKAACAHNVYLYFNMGGGLERYYNSNLDDVGPDRDEGMPSNRQGTFSQLIGYPGKLFGLYDGGLTNFSSILGYNLTGWHEIYRSPMAGMRITGGVFQTTPGSALNRFWAYVGGDVIWLPFPSLTTEPWKDALMEYTHEAVIESGWAKCGFADIYKFYQSIRTDAQNLVENNQWIEIDYKLDNATDWTTLDKVIFETGVELDFDELFGISGKKMKWRARSQTNNKLLAVRYKAMIIDTISRVPIKFAFSCSYRIKDGGRNLLGDKEDLFTAEEIQNILDEWASTIRPLRMRSKNIMFDNKRVIIDPIPLSLPMDNTEAYIGRLVITMMR